MKIKASSEKEAIEIAKTKMTLLDGNYTIKTIQSPKKKWLSKNMGVYEISLLDNDPAINEPQQRQEPALQYDESSSYVSIKDGKITVHNPSEDDNSPLLYVNNEHVTLTVNDKVVSSRIALKENDIIDITFHHIEPINHVTLSFSEDRMVATLNVVHKKGKTFYLKDIEKTNHGFIEVGFNEIAPQEITVQQCLDLLENANIKENFIDLDSIKTFVSDSNSSSLIVARGIELVQSQPAEVTYSPSLLEKTITDGMEPIVNKGEVLAHKKQAAIMGTVGVTLTGQEVKPKNVKDIILQAGEGAYLDEDDTKVISSIKGRPYLKKGIITVVPVLYVNGDLSKEMGNINFEGDVVAKGNVLDEISIRATGNIEIAGSAYNAEIFAENSVQIHGKAISCKIQAGIEQSKLYLASPYFIEINQNIMTMIRKIKANTSNNPQDKINIICQYKESIENKIKSINELSSLLDKNDCFKIDNLIKNLKNSLIQISLLKEVGFKMLLSFYNELAEFLDEIVVLPEETINLTIAYAQSCDLNSCGDIIITGKGSYQTNMVAQNEINYTNPVGVVKGGTIIAGSKIKAGIVGTTGEIYTECKVLKEDGIVEGNFYPGAVVYINNVKQDIVTIRN
ncbi:DUF342 domain-containing protein [Alkalibaculum sp. M08DMB]|uniref:DUF342 domain-containing protein n=1 Tax=Alkalibaculum sporogenes TaxID=2655001 RepID=A0A6A7K8S3_9FIRM|nr:FapA family protein [Alkalibaculum sporogenes]MPW25755.1 DUF342 domain-containing protein [Alkalibaculum sporogenes]